MIEELFKHYMTITNDPQAAATLVLADVTANKPVADATLSLKDASQVLGISDDSVGRLCRDGKLGHKRVGRKIRINRADLDKYLAETEREATPPLRCLQGSRR